MRTALRVTSPWRCPRPHRAEAPWPGCGSQAVRRIDRIAPLGPWSFDIHPVSVQRTRSAMSAGTDRSHPLHVRARAPAPVSSTSMRSVCDTRPERARRPAISSAARATGIVTVSTLSPPLSMSRSTEISGWARPADGIATSPPEARVHRRSPTSPKRSRTGPRPSASRSAQLAMPRVSRSSTVASARWRMDTGTHPRARVSPSAARKSRVSSAGTIMPDLAASTQARGPSAIPTKHSTPTAASTASMSREAASSSPPAQRAGPRARHLARPGRRHSTPAATVSKASMTELKARASRSRSRGRHTRSGHRYVASRTLMPDRTPLRLAAALASSTRSAWTTAPCPPGGRSTTRQLTGQSGTHRAM